MGSHLVKYKGNSSSRKTKKKEQSNIGFENGSFLRNQSFDIRTVVSAIVNAVKQSLQSYEHPLQNALM